MSENLLAQIAAQQQAAAAAAAANPVSYIPTRNKDWIREQKVLSICAVCHPLTATSGTGKTNHWTLSFDIGNGQGIGFDIQPNYQQTHTGGGMKAFVVSSFDYVVTPNAERSDLVKVTHSRPVSFYIDYLASRGRFRYAFTSEGVGCRHWIRDTLKLLADAGEIDSVDSESARRALTYTWPDNCASEPAAGTYF
ncbi:hypothetical protein CC80DRAFT_161789 [Byssothecium circinans]|uniref:DUF7770 domain-containing protein n=1 Tax=Byssothecium circinans TaxID=147558 RepID=A0A6A5UBE1_9PLEO|nr:hypothetical protein CC80DRAFT_161789 [Byssothecium circinans]